MNPISWKVMCGLLAPLFVAFGINKPVETPEAEVEKLDAYYQGRFKDLTGVDKGMLGRSRVESTSISKHGGGGGGRLPRIADRWYAVQIFGNVGKPLRFSDIQLRLHRWEGTVPDFAYSKSGREAIKLPEKDPVIKEAILRFKDPASKPIVVKRDVVRWELRPVRLSKKECLSCHSGMKMGDAVAVMAYAMGPLKNRK